MVDEHELAAAAAWHERRKLKAQGPRMSWRESLIYWRVIHRSYVKF